MAKEREKQFRSGNLKQSADHLIQRIDDIGIQALLEEDDGIRELTEQPCERVNATDLLNALKDKYVLIFYYNLPFRDISSVAALDRGPRITVIDPVLYSDKNAQQNNQKCKIW